MPLHELSLDDLRLYARIADFGSLSATAREANLAVSQVSRALRRVEAACGVQLVRRSTHGISLTPEGITVHQHVQRLLDEADALQSGLDAARGGVSGLVRVSMSAVLAEHLLVHSLGALRQLHPALTIDLRVSDALVDMVRDGVDIALRTGNPSSDALVVRPLGTLRRGLYASPAYLAQHGAPARMSDLARHSLITNSQHAQLNRWRFDTPEGAPQAVWLARGPYQSDNTATLASMALAGLGIARIVTVVAEPLVRQGRLQRVLADCSVEDTVPLSAFMVAGRHRLPRIRACLDHWAGWLAEG